MRGNGGVWNRAGRRSGGSRAIDLTPVPEITCACGSCSAFGLLPSVVIEGHEAKTCRGCGGVLFIRIDGQWRTADVIPGAANG